MITKSELISVSVKSQTGTGWGPAMHGKKKICHWGSDKGVAAGGIFSIMEGLMTSVKGMQPSSHKSLRRHFDPYVAQWIDTCKVCLSEGPAGGLHLISGHKLSLTSCYLTIKF